MNFHILSQVILEFLKKNNNDSEMLTFGPNKSRFSRGGNIINKLSSKVYQKKKLSNS